MLSFDPSNKEAGTVIEVDLNFFYLDLNRLFLSGWPKQGNAKNIKVTILIFTD